MRPPQPFNCCVAPVAALACNQRTHVGTTLIRFLAAWRSHAPTTHMSERSSSSAWPHRGSPETHRTAVACAQRIRIGTPFTHSVALYGVPPKAQMAAFACAHRTHVGTPLTRFVAPRGAPLKAPVALYQGALSTSVGTPLARFVVPQGAPQKAPVAAFPCATINAISFGTPLTRFVAP